MQITCRKCGGSHLTIKCGKDNITLNKLNIINLDKYDTNHDTNHDDKIKKQYVNKYNHRKIYRVKMSELPNDITEKELMELTYNWGDITKLKVLNYPENSVAYIDFKYEDQADYFVKALHKTVFEYLILSVCRVESEDYHKKI